MTARVSRMNLARWITTEEFGEQEEGEYVLPPDEDVPVQVRESFSVYTDRTLPKGNPQLLVRGVVVSVEREFLEVVAIKDEVKTALYTTTIHLAAV